MRPRVGLPKVRAQGQALCRGGGQACALKAMIIRAAILAAHGVVVVRVVPARCRRVLEFPACLRCCGAVLVRQMGWLSAAPPPPRPPARSPARRPAAPTWVFLTLPPLVLLRLAGCTTRFPAPPPRPPPPPKKNMTHTRHAQRALRAVQLHALPAGPLLRRPDPGCHDGQAHPGQRRADRQGWVGRAPGCGGGGGRGREGKRERWTRDRGVRGEGSGLGRGMAGRSACLMARGGAEGARACHKWQDCGPSDVYPARPAASLHTLMHANARLQCFLPPWAMAHATPAFRPALPRDARCFRTPAHSPPHHPRRRGQPLCAERHHPAGRLLRRGRPGPVLHRCVLRAHSPPPPHTPTHNAGVVAALAAAAAGGAALLLLGLRWRAAV